MKKIKLVLNESLVTNINTNQVDLIEDVSVQQKPDYQIIDITVIPDEEYNPTIQSILIDLDESSRLCESAEESKNLSINILSETVNIKTGYSNSLFEFENKNHTITLSLVLQETERKGIYKVEAYTTKGEKVFESNTCKPRKLIESYLNSLANEYLIDKPLKESAKLKEAGEWDDYDEDNIASKNNLTEVAKYIADRVPGGYYDEAKGFDAYQGPYAYVSSDIAGGELWYGETNELFQLETGYGWILGNKDTLVKALSDKDYLLQLVEEAKKYIDSLNESADIEDGTVYKLVISKDENSGPQTVWRFNTREAAEKEEEFFKSSGLYTRIDEEKITRSREDIQRRIEEIDREIENKVKRYSSAQKQYHGDNALSDRLEGEIDSLSVEKEKLQAMLNESEEIVKVLKDKNGGMTVKVIKAPNGRYFNYYYSTDEKHWDSSAGPFNTAEEAITMAKKHRPNAKELKESTDGEIEKLKKELRSRAEDLYNAGELNKLSAEDINNVAQSIKRKGFFISNNIFTDDSDEYEWQQINDFLDNELRDYDKNLKESVMDDAKDFVKSNGLEDKLKNSNPSDFMKSVDKLFADKNLCTWCGRKIDGEVFKDKHGQPTCEKCYKELNESEENDNKLYNLVKNLPDTVKYNNKTYTAFNDMSVNYSSGISKVYYCNMDGIDTHNPQDSNDYFVVTAVLRKVDNGYKGVDYIQDIEDFTTDSINESEEINWKEEEKKLLGDVKSVKDEALKRFYKIFVEQGKTKFAERVKKEMDRRGLKEAEDPMVDTVKEDLAIEPGSGEEAQLDSLNLRDLDEWIESLYEEGLNVDEIFNHLTVMNSVPEDYGITEDELRNKINSVVGDAQEGFSVEDFVKATELTDEVKNLNIDYSKWNDATQEERVKLVTPELNRFYNKYKVDFEKNPDLFSLVLYNLDDENFHTEANVLRKLNGEEI